MIPQPFTIRLHANKQLGLSLALLVMSCIAPSAWAGCGDEVYRLNPHHQPSTGNVAHPSPSVFADQLGTPPAKPMPCHGPNCSRQPVPKVPVQTVIVSSSTHDQGLEHWPGVGGGRNCRRLPTTDLVSPYPFHVTARTPSPLRLIPVFPRGCCLWVSALLQPPTRFSGPQRR